MKKENIGYLILVVLLISAVLGMALISPIEQDQAYHNFSDNKSFLHIPNFWNVVSNLPFLVVGVIGMCRLNLISSIRSQYFVFFLGIIIVSFGSSYYHWNPNNETLVWDRLPMTIAFMALFSAVISEYIDVKIGQLVLIPALFVGILSVVYWIIFNDLRIYALVQFFPMLAIPVILIFFKSKYNYSAGYWFLGVTYIIAKLLEHFDYAAHTFTIYLSGHSLKHFCSALGIYGLILLRMKHHKMD